MAKIADYISKNIKRINHDIKIGLIPLSVMQNYDIYKMYLSVSEIEKRPMKRYTIVANRMKISVSTVRVAISKMKSNY